MLHKKSLYIVLFLTILLLPSQAQAFVVINEIFADPASDLSGDANGDGVSSSSQDEFVELINFGVDGVDISGWSITDAVKARHIFPIGTLISPYEYLVIFGGGSPTLADVNWQKASTGGLSLNNTADTITLFDDDGGSIDQVIYDSLANHDQSIVRSPEGTGDAFVQHESLNTAQGKLFSPGRSVEGRNVYLTSNNRVQGAVVPEISGIISFGLGWVSMVVGTVRGNFFRKKKSWPGN